MSSLERVALSALAAVIALVLLSAIMYHRGYTHGESDRTAFYEPILRKEREAKIAADKRTDEAEASAVAINHNLEIEHAQAVQDLLARSTAAESRIADLLRQRAAASARSRQQVPSVPPAANGRDGPGPSDPRDDGLARGISAVGASCEHDADALGRWQEWYRAQQQSLARSLETGQR